MPYTIYTLIMISAAVAVIVAGIALTWIAFTLHKYTKYVTTKKEK